MKKLILVLILVISSFANESIKDSDIEKMAAKMVILGFFGTSIDENSSIYKDIKKGLGGVILFDKDPNDKNKSKNIIDKKQLKELNSSLQAISKRKLLIGIDQEGGIVQRVNSKIGFTDTLKASEIAKKGEEFAQASYKKLSRELSETGVNLNFAPSVDMALNPKNRVVVTNGRSYSANINEVIKYSSIFIDELNKSGIFATIKHFPGHGSSLNDSHLGFVDITNTWSEKELEPYKYFINNNKIDIIMTAHVYNANIDNIYPATLSYNTNTGLLRDELGYEGVLITDDLQMSAITKHYSVEETITLAINSGVNLLLFANQLAKPITLDEIIEIIRNGVKNNTISLENIIESNIKIDKLLDK